MGKEIAEKWKIKTEIRGKTSKMWAMSGQKCFISVIN